MYDKVREIAEAKRVVKFSMYGEEASFHESEDGEWLFTVGGEDNIICFAPDLDCAIECLTDECDEDGLEILDQD